jgi:hypothetical protein
MLPAKGALVNPIELWNMHVKRVMDAMQPAGMPRDSWQQLIRGPRSRDDAFSMLRDAIIELNRNTELFRWCYHARATGAHAMQRLEGHAVAEAVRAARAAAPVAPFDVMQAAFAPRCRMSTDHPYPPSKCCAETYNVYFWRHHRLRLHAGLPPPFVRPVDAADGSERSCRLCKPNTNGARARATRSWCAATAAPACSTSNAWAWTPCREVRGNAHHASGGMSGRCACGRTRSRGVHQGRDDRAAAAART